MTETTISVHEELLAKGTRNKESRYYTKKQSQQPSCFSHLKKGDRGHEYLFSLP